MKNLSSILKLNRILILIMSLFFLSACNSDSLTEAENNGPSATPLKANTNSRIVTLQKSPISVMYVEVNNNDIREVGKYKLSNGQQLFDVAIIFAANINYNTTTQKAYLHFNDQVTNVLTNSATYIKPLQDKGIKVMLSVLGNHQGAGFANFPSQAAAQAFAQELANAVNTYGLDGIDFDDEYAEYGNNSTPQPNASSFVYLVTALRDLLPDKIISFYNIGPSASNLSYNGVTVGSKVDFAWNPYYSTYSAPNIPGLVKSQLGAAAIDVTATSSSTVTSFATKTKADGYGVYLCYNLTSNNIASYISNATNALYGYTTTYDNGTTTPSATDIVSGATYTLVSAVNNSSVLDVASSGTTNGTKVQLWGSNNSNAQKWVITSLNNGYYKLQPANAPTKALDDSGSSTANGTQQVIWSYGGTSNQQWKITSVGNGYFTLSPACAPNSCLDVNQSATADGTKIQLWTANGSNAQKWKLVKL